MVYDKIEIIEFELTSTCNCYCPGCHRHVVESTGIRFNPTFKNNNYMDVSLIEDVLSNPRVSKNVQLSLVGTFGEAIAHPKFLDIIDLIYSYRPHASIRINTNGSLRTPEFFTRLAKSLQRFSPYEMMWAVDGLEDTNHIYRRGSIWSKIMENMDAFIAAGGRSHWQFIEFPWNKHQREEIKQLAKSKNMDFYPRRNGTPHVETEIDKPTISEPASMARYDIIVDRENVHIKDDECISMNQIHVNVLGEVHPCCLFNASTYSHNISAIQEMDKFIYRESRDWMNLNKFSFEEVMSNSWWQFLHSTFEGNDDTCSLCIAKCGKKKTA